MSFINTRAYALFHQQPNDKELSPVHKRPNSKPKTLSDSFDTRKREKANRSGNKPNFPQLKIRLADLLTKDAPNRVQKRTSELRSTKDEVSASALVKEGVEDELVDLVNNKMSVYLDAVRQFTSVAVNTVDALNSQATIEVENSLRSFHTQRSSLDDLTRQMERMVSRVSFSFKSRRPAVDASNPSQRSIGKGFKDSLDIQDESPSLLNQSSDVSFLLQGLEHDNKIKDKVKSHRLSDNKEIQNLRQMVSYLEQKNNLLLHRLQSTTNNPLEFSVQGADITDKLIDDRSSERRKHVDTDYSGAESAKLRPSARRENSNNISRTGKHESLESDMRRFVRDVDNSIDAKRNGVAEENRTLRIENQKLIDAYQKAKGAQEPLKKELVEMEASYTKLKYSYNIVKRLYDSEKRSLDEFKKLYGPQAQLALLRRTTYGGRTEKSLERSADAFKDVLRNKQLRDQKSLQPQRKESKMSTFPHSLLEKSRDWDMSLHGDDDPHLTQSYDKSFLQQVGEPSSQTTGSLVDFGNDSKDVSREIVRNKGGEKTKKAHVMDPDAGLDVKFDDLMSPISPQKVTRPEAIETQKRANSPGRMRIATKLEPKSAEYPTITITRTDGLEVASAKPRTDYIGLQSVLHARQRSTGVEQAEDKLLLRGKSLTDLQQGNPQIVAVTLNKENHHLKQLIKKLQSDFNKLQEDNNQLKQAKLQQNQKQSSTEEFYTNQVNKLQEAVDGLQNSLDASNQLLNHSGYGTTAQERKIEEGIRRLQSSEILADKVTRELEEKAVELKRTNLELINRDNELQSFANNLELLKQELAQKSKVLQEKEEQLQTESAQSESIKDTLLAYRSNVEVDKATSNAWNILKTIMERTDAMNAKLEKSSEGVNAMRGKIGELKSKLVNTLAVKNKLEEDLKKLENENQAILDEKEDILKRGEDLSEGIESLQNHVRQLEEHQKQQQNAEEALIEQNKMLEEQEAKHQDELEEASEFLQKAKKDILEQRVHYENTIKTLNEEIKALNTVLANRGQEVSKSQEVHEKELIKHIQQIKSLKGHLEEKEEESRERKAIQESQMSMLAKEAEKLKTEVVKQQSILEEKEVAHKKDLSRLDDEVNELKVRNDHSQQEKASLEERLSEASKQVEKLKEDLDEKKNSIKQAEEANVSLQRQIEEVSSALNAKEAEKKSIEQQVEEVSQQISALKNTITQKEVEIEQMTNTYKDAVETLKGEMASLEKELAEKSDEYEKRQIQHQEETSYLKKEIEQKEQEVADLSKQTEEKQRVYEESQSRLVEEIATIKSSLTQNELEGQDKLRSLNEELHSLKQEYTDLSNTLKEKEKLSNEVKDQLQEQLNAVQEVLSSSKTEAVLRDQEAQEIQAIHKLTVSQLSEKLQELEQTLSAKEQQSTNQTQQYGAEIKQLNEKILSLTSSEAEKIQASEEARKNHEEETQRLREEVNALTERIQQSLREHESEQTKLLESMNILCESLQITPTERPEGITVQEAHTNDANTIQKKIQTLMADTVSSIQRDHERSITAKDEEILNQSKKLEVTATEVKEAEEREESLKQEVDRLKRGIDLLKTMFESTSAMFELEKKEDAREELITVVETLQSLTRLEQFINNISNLFSENGSAEVSAENLEESSIDALKDHIKDTFNQLLSKFKTNEEALKSKTEEASSLNLKFEETNKEHHIQQTTYKKDLETLSEKLHTSHTEITALEAKVTHLNDELKAKTHLSSTQTAEVEDLKKKVQTGLEEISWRDSKIVNLNKDLLYKTSELEGMIAMKESLEEKGLEKEDIVENYRKQLREKEQVIVDLKKEINELEEKGHHHQHAERELKDRIAQAENMIEEGKQAILHLENSLKVAEETLKEKDAQIEELVSEFEAQRGENERLDTQLEATSEEYAKTLEETQVKLDNFSETLKRLEKEKGEAEKELEVLQQETEERYNQQAKESSKKIQELTNALNAKEETIAVISEKLKSQHKDQTESSKSKQTEIGELTASKAELEKKVATLNNKVNALLGETMRAEQENKELETKLQSLTATFNEERKLYHDAQAQTKKALDESKSIEQKLRDQIKDSEGIVHALQEANSNHEATIKQQKAVHEKFLSESGGNIAGLAKEIEAQRQAIEDKDTKIKSLEDKVAALEAEVKQNSQASAEQKQNFAELNDVVKSLNETMAHLQTEKTVLEESLRSYESELEQEKRKLEEAEAIINNKNKEIQEVNQAVADIQKASESIGAQHTEEVARLQAEQAKQLQDIEKQVEELAAELVRAENHIAENKQSLDLNLAELKLKTHELEESRQEAVDLKAALSSKNNEIAQQMTKSQQGRDGQIESLGQHIAELSNKLEVAQNQIDEQRNIIEEKLAELRLKDQSIADNDKLQSEKDQEIEELRQAGLEKDEEIDQLNDLVNIIRDESQAQAEKTEKFAAYEQELIKLRGIKKAVSILLDEEVKEDEPLSPSGEILREREGSWEMKMNNLEHRVTDLIETKKQSGQLVQDKEKAEARLDEIGRTIGTQRTRIFKLQELLDDRLKILNNETLNDDINELVAATIPDDSFDKTSERLSSRIQEEIERNLTLEGSFEYQGSTWCIICNKNEQGKGRKFLIKPVEDVATSFLKNELPGKTLFKDPSSKANPSPNVNSSLIDNLDVYFQNLIREIFEHTQLILKGTEAFNSREFEFEPAHAFREVVESNEKLLKAIGDVQKFGVKNDKASQNLLSSVSEIVDKALEKNVLALNLCSDYEKVSGGESPISLHLNRNQSNTHDLSMMVNEMRPGDISLSSNKLDQSIVELEDQINSKDETIRSMGTKIDILNMSQQKAIEENGFLRKNVENTKRVQGELRQANDKFKVEYDKIVLELQDRENDEQRLVMQMQILKKELEEMRTKLNQTEGIHEREHLKKILTKFLENIFKNEQLKDCPELLKMVCSMILCTEVEKNKLLDGLNKFLAGKNKGLLKMFG